MSSAGLLTQSLPCLTHDVGHIVGMLDALKHDLEPRLSGGRNPDASDSEYSFTRTLRHLDIAHICQFDLRGLPREQAGYLRGAILCHHVSGRSEDQKWDADEETGNDPGCAT